MGAYFGSVIKGLVDISGSLVDSFKVAPPITPPIPKRSAATVSPLGSQGHGMSVLPNNSSARLDFGAFAGGSGGPSGATGSASRLTLDAAFNFSLL